MKILLIVLLLSGCAGIKPKHVAVAGIMADGITTYGQISERCIEGNEAYADMNRDQLMGVAVAAAALIYWAGDSFPWWINYGVGAFRGGLAVRNASLDCH